MGGFEYFYCRGYSFLVPIKSHLCVILKKAIVYDFPKNCYHQIVWKWINWRWMARFRTLDQTSHSHIRFGKRHIIHVHWTGNGPEWHRCFVGINFLCGNNHIAGPKSPKYIFTERLATSLTYSSFDSKLGVFTTYNSEKIGISAVAVTWVSLLGARCINLIVRHTS